MDGSAASHRVGPPRAGIAERIWEAARHEFSRRGYHGARVQGIARGAACNVALMYRHWPSKRALYLDILRAVWLASANEIARIAEGDGVAPRQVVASLVDAMMGDPMGAQILIREYLDGAPFLAHLSSSDPAILAPVRRAAAAFTGGGLDPVVAVVTVGGFAALVASTREAAGPFLGEPIQPEAWRRHVLDLLANGLSSGPGPAGGRGNGAAPP
jgi:TetR/AcrR family transcriptional regulator